MYNIVAFANNKYSGGSMENFKKRNLLNMTYYALTVLSFVFAVLFMVYIVTQSTLLYAQIIYGILIVLFVGLVIFDIICTNMRRYKYIGGIILFIMTILIIAMSIVTYISLSTDLVLTVTQLYPYFALMLMSYLINTFVIVLYVVGIKLVDMKTRRTSSTK